ncbi:acyl-CoA dehydrogenase family protein [Rhodococcus sp. NPDC057014]|uniref:acyl-CoA dehydrogenase family protein n=1 Tax=Rhodococcus sp. NPDC057014 TaxID=3346000 RepID=UPI0036384226
MDFRDTPDEAVFRAELRTWLTNNVPTGTGTSEAAADTDLESVRHNWNRTLHEAGYAGLTWPREYGGQGLAPTYQAIFHEETAAADAPASNNYVGLNIAGPTIIAWGNDEQKRRFLPPLLSGDEIWCQGFSEPGSGSDLAGARTKAVLDGSSWIVNGQKVWSSFAHLARWCVLLVRTDPSASKHAGLSYLLVDMHSPGVEVRPLRQLTGESEFNEIFFTDVRVPRESILGAPGDGWKVAMTTLEHERGTASFALAAWLQRNLSRLIDLAHERGRDGTIPADDPLIRDAIAHEWVSYQALRFTNYRSMTTILKTGSPGPESSVTKLAWSEANQRLTKLARSIQGADGSLDGPDAVWDGFWQYEQLRSRGNTIEGGTSEILRNIIAERVLDLPRSR